MALESKPLFHPEVPRQQVRSFNLAEQTGAWQPKLQHWADLISSRRADHFKETALLPDFLTDIFCGLLGYTEPVKAADAYTLSRERHVEVDGKFADAALGRFQKDKEQFIAVLEGKGTHDPLDRPFTGRRMYAVRGQNKVLPQFGVLSGGTFLLTPPRNGLLAPLWPVPSLAASSTLAAGWRGRRRETNEAALAALFSLKMKR